MHACNTQMINAHFYYIAVVADGGCAAGSRLWQNGIDDRQSVEAIFTMQQNDDGLVKISCGAVVQYLRLSTFFLHRLSSIRSEYVFYCYRLSIERHSSKLHK